MQNVKMDVQKCLIFFFGFCILFWFGFFYKEICFTEIFF